MSDLDDPGQDACGHQERFESIERDFTELVLALSAIPERRGNSAIMAQGIADSI